MLEPEFYSGRKGKIIKGKYISWAVEIVADSASETGGHYSLLTDSSVALAIG